MVFSLYNFLKYVHILGVVVWLGGVIMFLILQTRIAASRDPATMRVFSAHGKFLGNAVFGPSAMIVLITGIGLVQVGKLSFGLPWITWGFVGLTLSIVVGGVIAGRTAARLSKDIAAGTADTKKILETQQRLKWIGVFNIALLASVVFAMVFKFS